MLKKNASFGILIIMLLLSSCFSEHDEKQEMENNPVRIEDELSTIPVVVSSNSNWMQSKNIVVSATSKNGILNVDLDLQSIKSEVQKAVQTAKDTFENTVFYYQLTCNDKPIEPDHTTSSKSQVSDNFIVESSLLSAGFWRQINVELPYYRLKNIPANSKAIIKLRVWQDYFLTERKYRTIVTNGIEASEYYRDTLKKKIIDNVYSFSVLVPEIYETAIVCDSIFLQNDKDWSPSGSDNTIWKSSYPDIYFSISDVNWKKQSDSHIESSAASFTTSDTLSFYHYSPIAEFRLDVLDHDALSRDDILGTWKYDVSKMTNLKSYNLKFGHVDRFYFYKINRGRLN